MSSFLRIYRSNYDFVNGIMRISALRATPTPLENVREHIKLSMHDSLSMTLAWLPSMSKPLVFRLNSKCVLGYLQWAFLDIATKDQENVKSF